MGGSGIESIDRALATSRLPEFPGLLELALRSREHARAPYSGFKVGAAVLGSSGNRYGGCNVESASYGATICAERGAVAAAVAAGETAIRACVVVTSTPSPSTPCGICRQVLAEFGPDVAVYAASTEGQPVLAARLADLLPASFGADDLADAKMDRPADRPADSDR